MSYGRQGNTMGSRKTSGAKRPGSWHMVHHRDGRQTLIAPDRRKLAGTRRELAEAGLSPRSRAGLANSMKLKRYAAQTCSEAAARLRRDIANLRLDAIDMERRRRKQGESLRLPVDMFIMAGASARYMGQRADEFFQEAIRSAIEGVIDLALSNGENELPLTRQERLAFKGRQEDYHLAFRIKEIAAAL